MWMVEESSGVVLGWRFKREIKLGFFRVERGRRVKRGVTLGFDEGGGGLMKDDGNVQKSASYTALGLTKAAPIKLAFTGASNASTARSLFCTVHEFKW